MSERTGSRRHCVRPVNEPWAFSGARLQRWTPADCAETFPDETDDGQVYEVRCNWVISHLFEHDLHPDGESSLIIGMNNLEALQL